MLLISIANFLFKITGWPAYLICTRNKVIYEDKKTTNRFISKGAIIISNHTSLIDFPVWVFFFWNRTLRFQMAEVLFKKFPLRIILKLMGGIYVNRNNCDFSFMNESERLLAANRVVGIFPESRLPLPEEERPLPFKESAAYIALSSGKPVIPVYTSGNYFKKKRNTVVIGKAFYASEFEDTNLSDKVNIQNVTNAFRNKIIELERMADEGNQK